MDAEDEDDDFSIVSPPKHEKDLAKLLGEGFESLASSYTINNMQLEDQVDHELTYGRAEMVRSRPWDHDALRLSALEDQQSELEDERREEEREKEAFVMRSKKQSGLRHFPVGDEDEESESKDTTLGESLGNMLSRPTSPLRAVGRNPFKKPSSPKDTKKLEEKDVQMPMSDLSFSPRRGLSGRGFRDGFARGLGISKKKTTRVAVKKEESDEKEGYDEEEEFDHDEDYDD